MQAMIHLMETDRHLIGPVDGRAIDERLSQSVVMLPILGEHFEEGGRFGEILEDLEAVSRAGLAGALELRRRSRPDKQLREVLAREYGMAHRQSSEL